MNQLEVAKLREDARDAAQLLWQNNELERRRNEDKEWQSELEREKSKRDVISKILLAVVAAVVGMLATKAADLLGWAKPEKPTTFNIVMPNGNTVQTQAEPAKP